MTDSSIPCSAETRDRIASLKRRASAVDDEDVTYDDILVRMADSYEQLTELADVYDIDGL